MLGHVTHGDAEGRRWIVHKLAQKVQDPNLVSKIAMVFATTQGAGKGFLFRVMAEILGPENCAIVTQGELEGRFFGRYATKLLLLGDEVTSSENLRDISQKLKVLIDGGEIEAERKYENSVAIRSRMMWMFASNDPISSVNAEGSDRRYTFFSNFDPVTPEYTAALNACFEKDRVTLTAAFKEEIAGFAAHLLATEVDVAFVSKPYANDARKALIEANRPSHEMFFREIDDQGFDALHEYFADKDWAVRDNKAEEWDFGEKGVATSVLYQVYRAYCRASGHHSLRLNKFGGALKNRVPAYEHVRNRTKNGRQVWCYVVPRKGAQ
jgi:phage/plasmid-associated DNA primase